MQWTNERTLVLLALAVAMHTARSSTEADEYLNSNTVATPSEELRNTTTAKLRADQRTRGMNHVLAEAGGDDRFVEVDKAAANTLSQTRSKSHTKTKYFFSFFFSCDASRRRRDDESVYKGDPDCSGFDCQHGMSRRRRSDDCSSTSCLPAQSTVQMERLGTVPITRVQVGDQVLTSDGYSEVRRAVWLPPCVPRDSGVSLRPVCKQTTPDSTSSCPKCLWQVLFIHCTD